MNFLVVNYACSGRGMPDARTNAAFVELATGGSHQFVQDAPTTIARMHLALLINASSCTCEHYFDFVCRESWEFRANFFQLRRADAIPRTQPVSIGYLWAINDGRAGAGLSGVSKACLHHRRSQNQQASPRNVLKSAKAAFCVFVCVRISNSSRTTSIASYCQCSLIASSMNIKDPVLPAERRWNGKSA